MIEVLIEHSSKEDYHVIDEILVNLPRPGEKERVQQLIEKNELVGSFVEFNEDLAKKLADLLEVKKDLIVIDTFEIDEIADDAESADDQESAETAETAEV